MPAKSLAVPAAPPTDDYQQGYADGVRDAAAWAAKHAADLVTLAAGLRREAETLVTAADRVEAGARQFENAAQNRWAQWVDRRNWPSVQDLVAQHRSGAQAPPPSQRVAPKRRAKPPPTGPSLNLTPSPIPSNQDGRLDEEQQMKQAAGRAWRA